MVVSHLILAALWTLYCVLHSVLASLGVKQWIRKTAVNGARYYRLFYTVFAAVSLVAIIAYQWSIDSPRLFAPATAINIVGGAVAIAGIALMLVCIKKYFMSLSGLRSLFEERPAAELMIAGIHRYVRHPLYSGTFLFVWGLWMLFPTASLLIADLVITLYTIYAIGLEEEKLVLEFGDQYRRYQKNVPKLIPRF